MNYQNIKSNNLFGPFKFDGKVMKRSICVYSVSFDILRQGYKFEVINMSNKEASFLIGNCGKTLRYQKDRSIKFHIPQSIIKNYDKTLKINIYTKDIRLANLFSHIKGLIKLKGNNMWFKCDSSRKFNNSSQLTINSRGLSEYFHQNKIKSVYVDKRRNYAVIKPTELRPSRNSFISKVWINDESKDDKISFFVPGLDNTIYVCLSNTNFKINSRLFQTKEEFELAKELIQRHNVLCVSGKQTHDIKLLNINESYVKEETAINLKNIKKGGVAYGQVFSDILKGVIFYQKNKKTNFLILNKNWEDYNHFKNFADIDIIEFSKKQGVNIIFSDYKKEWWESVSKQIEFYFPSFKDNIAPARSA